MKYESVPNLLKNCSDLQLVPDRKRVKLVDNSYGIDFETVENIPAEIDK